LNIFADWHILYIFLGAHYSYIKNILLGSCRNPSSRKWPSCQKIFRSSSQRKPYNSNHTSH